MAFCSLHGKICFPSGGALVFVAACLCAATVSRAQSVADPWAVNDLSVSPTLKDLAPVQPYAVPHDDVAAPVPLPEPLPFDGSGPIDGPGTGNSFLPAPAQVLLVDPAYSRGLTPLRSDAGVTGFKPDGGQTRLSLVSAGKTDTWVLGSQNWTYSRDDGTSLVLGNSWSGNSIQGNRARLGGIALSHSAAGDGQTQGSLQYSVVLGALDYSGETLKPGGLTYGPTAGESVLSYGVDPQLSLETQTQWAPNLAVNGVGGKYSTRDWGAWQVAVARATRDFNQGWRYRIGYEARVLDSLKLGWTHETRSEGFSDLSSYQNSALDSARSRQQWTATLALGRWGNLIGTYEQIYSASGPLQQQFGLTQQFWYSQNLRISLGARHEFVTGDYDVNVNFAVPLY